MVHNPTESNDSYGHRKNFFRRQGRNTFFGTCPKAKFNVSLAYTINKSGFGKHLTHYSNIKTKGFGWTGFKSLAGTDGPGDPAISGSFTGIDSYIDSDKYLDADFSGYRVHIVPEVFSDSAKVTTDLFLSYKFCNLVSLFMWFNILFNVHPDFAAVPNARLQSFDNQTGGLWESV